jgi:hypothetical protein
LSCRAVGKIGSSLSIFSRVLMGSQMSILDNCECGSMLSLRGMARLDPTSPSSVTCRWAPLFRF